MEQLVIFLLFVVGSIVSSIIQHKKKQAEAARESGLAGPERPKPSGRPIMDLRRSSQDWREQLRRMLEGEMPPPVIRPNLPPPPKITTSPRRTARSVTSPAHIEGSEGEVEVKNPLQASSAKYQRVSNLRAGVEERMRAIDLQTTTHKPARLAPPRAKAQSEFVKNLHGRPKAVRQAFVASLIFGPPKGLQAEEFELESLR